MKNILFIGHESDLNGASKSLLNIISILENTNNIYVLTSYSEGAFYDELQKHTVEILVYPFFRWSVKKHYSRFALKNEYIWFKQKLAWKKIMSKTNEATASAVAEIVKKEKIDVIHTNTGVLNIGAMIKNRVGDSVKHIWHIREFADLDFDMYPLISRKKYSSYMNNNTDKFICISKAVYDHYDFLENDKKIIIYNGIDNVNKITQHTSHSGVNFLISGRISETKGQHEAVSACEKLMERGFSDFRLYIAGSGNLYFDIPEKCREHIILLGQVSNMPELRKDMDVELVCSKAEAFGRVTAEAMMGGLPVIGSNTGGTPELILSGNTGFLYEYGNAYDLADKMQFFIEDKTRIASIAVDSQKYALENFTIERCVSEIYKNY